MADQVASLFKPAVVGLDHLMGGVDHLVWGGGEEGGDIGVSGRAIGLERQKIIPAAVQNGLGDGGLCADGVDGDDGAGEFKAREQQGDCSDFVGFSADRLLPENEALTAGPGLDHVQRLAAIGPVMGAS